MNTAINTSDAPVSRPEPMRSPYGSHTGEAGLALLDYRVGTRRLSYDGPYVGTKVETRYRAIVREDTGEVLGTVKGDNWVPLQNDRMVDVARQIAKDGVFEIDCAGCAKGGLSYIMLANREQRTVNVGDVFPDTISPYLMLYNRNDGRSAFGFTYTAIRRCCTNVVGDAVRRGNGRTFAHNLGNITNYHAAVTGFREYADHIVRLAQRLREVIVPTPSIYDSQLTRKEALALDIARIFGVSARHAKVASAEIVEPSQYNRWDTRLNAWNVVNGLTRADRVSKSALNRAISGAADRYTGQALRACGVSP